MAANRKEAHVSELMKIGEVAEKTALSIRSLRHYDEMGLASPSAHSPGGFRLYTDADVDRLLMIRRMKPLGFPLARIREFARALDVLEGGDAAGGAAPPTESAGDAASESSTDGSAITAASESPADGSAITAADAIAIVEGVQAETAERLRKLRKHLAFAEEFSDIVDGVARRASTD